GAIHALGDVGRLLVVGDQDGAALVIDAIVGIVVSDTLDGVSRDLDVVDIGGGGDFARQDDQPGVAECLGSNAGVGILGENGIENGIGYLVGDLVGVTFGYGFGSKQKIVICHSDTSYEALDIQLEVERNALHLGHLRSR